MRTVRVINEELVDQDRLLHRYPLRLHLQHHHHHDQMVLFDEKVQQIHVIVIQDGNMTVKDDDDIIRIIIVDEQDRGQEDGEFKLVFFLLRNHSRFFNLIQISWRETFYSEI